MKYIRQEIITLIFGKKNLTFIILYFVNID